MGSRLIRKPDSPSKFKSRSPNSSRLQVTKVCIKICSDPARIVQNASEQLKKSIDFKFVHNRENDIEQI
ncbi:hypothetical protein RJT34_06021 [Clitoria ternatea]|uniref:Uncharacterized protein n=1 Tax=Clitoria ternatea TaxID=43366 RepID=A0AAN9PU26_CLITE